MNPIFEHRRDRLRKLLKDNNLEISEFAVLIGKSHSYAAQLVSYTNACSFGEKMARHIEKCLKKKPGYLDESEQKIDHEILHLVIAKLESALSKKRITLKTNEKAALITYLYELKTGSEIISDNQLRKIISEKIK